MLYAIYFCMGFLVATILCGVVVLKCIDDVDE